MRSSPIEKALWFIESHLTCNLTLDEVAGVCGISRFQLSRLFSHAVGTTMSAYVRGRRLTGAARTLADGACDILAVALQAGYGSHEAFSRGFRDQFGLTPAEVRTRGHLGGLALVEPMREDPVVCVRLPPPRIEARGPLLIAGIGRRFACDEFAGIPALWHELHPHLGEIPGQKGDVAYGVVAADTAAGHSYFYLAGVEVSDVSGLDRVFTSVELPAQRWAVCSQQGHITTIASAINAVFGQALPAAGLTPKEGHDVLERYGANFDPQTGRGGFDICVPVE